MNYINKLIYIHTRRKYLKKRQNGGCENISPLSIFKNAPEYIDPSGHFVFYKIVCRSNVYNAKYLRQFWINYNNFSSIFLWYLSTNFGRKIFNFNYQQNLENIVYVKFHKEGRNPNSISHYYLSEGLKKPHSCGHDRKRGVGRGQPPFRNKMFFFS